MSSIWQLSICRMAFVIIYLVDKKIDHNSKTEITASDREGKRIQGLRCLARIIARLHYSGVKNRDIDKHVNEEEVSP